MYLSAGQLVLSPSDLVAHLECPHLTTLNRGVAEGRRPRPERAGNGAEVVRRRGGQHEAAVLATFGERRRVVEIPRGADPTEAEELTLAAMRDGADCVYQAVLFDGRWLGRADFLLRDDTTPSELGGWSYTVADTKLARQVKASALLQMALYGRRLHQLQGTPPRTLTVILGTGESVAVPYVDVAAYAWRALREYEAWLEAGPQTYPERVRHCGLCPWSAECDGRWRGDDDLFLVPFVRRAQREALREAGIGTVSDLAVADPDALSAVVGVGPAVRRRLAAQARLQVAARRRATPPYEFVTPVEPGRGLAALPDPDSGDLFLDLEGDPFHGEHGLEYLWGVTDAGDRFSAWWAHDSEAEQRAFEQVVDHLVATWRAHPDMHVYHYAAYEPSRLKALSQRYASRIDEVDALLRGQRLVDLYAVVRQGLRVGTESYSIKALEALYSPDGRAGAQVTNAADSIAEYERWLATGDQAILDAIAAYNRDDCISTRRLRDWLERCRDELARLAGHPVPRPEVADSDPALHLTERDPELVALEERLLRGVAAEPAARTAGQRARAALVGLLEWHRREERAQWWEFFRVSALGPDELVDDPAPLGGLRDPQLLRTEKRSGVWRYTVPLQESRIRVGDKVRHSGPDGGSSTVVGLGLDAGWVELKRDMRRDVPHPAGLLPPSPVSTEVLRAAIVRVANWAADRDLDAPEAPDRFPGVCDLLVGRPPRLAGDVALRQPGESAAEALCRVAPVLQGVLPVQGPPGAGKTYAGARAILAVLAAGRTVGITALSHRGVTNLLDEVMAADDHHIVRAMQKADPASASSHPRVQVVGSNDSVESALADRTVNLVAGTGWLFARPDVHVDVLVIDEAGQLSLANTVAAGASADALVLLGDPRQLPQPSQGVHPEGADGSAFDVVLGEHDTVPADRGLFLDTTWRMHPQVCAPVSELSYDGLLVSREGLEHQVLGGTDDQPGADHVSGTGNPAGADDLAGAGIRWYPVHHTGCSTRSPAEAEVVATLVDRLHGRMWTDATGHRVRLGAEDILVVAPYNAQVGELAARLEGRARVGTVDKFQGQQAPVVIISLTTSSAADAPRGVEFVANRNRLNVAVSRARTLAVLVGSPALLTAPASSVAALQGVNALCRLVEYATAGSAAPEDGGVRSTGVAAEVPG